MGREIVSESARATTGYGSLGKRLVSSLVRCLFKDRVMAMIVKQSKSLSSLGLSFHFASIQKNTAGFHQKAALISGSHSRVRFWHVGEGKAHEGRWDRS